MTKSLRDRVLAALDPVVWRSCLDISQRLNANSIDVGCSLKCLITQKLVIRRTNKADKPINFCYRRTDTHPVETIDAVIAKLTCEVTPEMRRSAAKIVQMMLAGCKRAAVSDELGIRAQYVNFIASNQLRFDGAGYMAPAYAVLRVLDYYARMST